MGLTPFVYLLRSRRGSHEWRSLLGLSALFVWASLYKQHTVLAVPLLMGAHLVLPPSGFSRRRTVGQILAVFGFGCLCWGGLFAYFAITDRFAIAFATLVTWTSDWTGSPLDHFLNSLSIEIYRSHAG